MSSFVEQVIFITGAASGFGRLLAERLAESGAYLILGDLNEEGLNEVVEGIQKSSPNPTAILARGCDVTQESQVKDLIEAGIEKFGRLDIAINNAGMGTPVKPFVEITEDEMDINFAVNTKGVFFGMKYQLQQMRAQGGGSILNVSSMAGIGAAPKFGAYSAAKHAVIGLTRTAAVEYGRYNIRVNAVCPFYSPTPLVTDAIPQSQQDLVASGCPMKRLADPEEVVEVILSVCSPANTFMNGQAVAVDGGISAY